MKFQALQDFLVTQADYTFAQVEFGSWEDL